ncbi:MAG: hypothetical protein JZU65_24500 [Chlorobium sp.]|nr:hypothetical protein [Chlorobium sp.]
MKNSLIITAFFLSLFTFTTSSSAFVGTGIRALETIAPKIEEALELGSKVSGKNLSTVARQSAREQLMNAAVRHGDSVVPALRKGGLELLEAAGSHGDEIWKFASAVPEASRALAMKPDVYLPLCRKYGEDILLIEAKSFSSGPRIAELFGENGVRIFAKKVPTEQINKLTALAAKADSQDTRNLLLEGWEKTKGAILEHLDVKHILAYGLSATMVTSGWKVSDGMQTSMQTVADIHPELVGKTISEVTSPIMTPVKHGLYALITLILAGFSWKFRRFFRSSLKQF